MNGRGQPYPRDAGFGCWVLGAQGYKKTLNPRKGIRKRPPSRIRTPPPPGNRVTDQPGRFPCTCPPALSGWAQTLRRP